MRPSFSAPELGQQYVSLRPQGAEILLERAHALANLADPPLELGLIERAKILRHKPRR